MAYLHPSHKKYPVQKHMLSIHGNMKPFECSLCDQKFSQKGGLKSHVEHIHEGKKYKHECPHCETSSHSPKLLQDHIASAHEGKKPYKCSLCDFGCQSKQGLMKHTMSIHENLRPFQCPLVTRVLHKRGI